MTPPTIKTKAAYVIEVSIKTAISGSLSNSQTSIFSTLCLTLFWIKRSDTKHEVVVRKKNHSNIRIIDQEANIHYSVGARSSNGVIRTSIQQYPLCHRYRSYLSYGLF